MSCIWPIFQSTTQNLLWGLKNNERCHSILNQLWPSNQSCSRFENISTKWSWLHQRCPPKNLPLEPILTNCSTLVRKAREEHLGVFLQAYHFLFAMYSNLVSVSVIIFFFFSHSYSATTRTRHLEGDYPITTFFWKLSRFFANGPIKFINLWENIVAN